MTSRFMTAVAMAAMVLTIASCGGKGKEKDKEEEADPSVVKPDTTQIVSKKSIPEEPVFDINTTLGTIRIQLYKDTPKHRDNFVKLAMSGYYNKCLIHRVAHDFVIQGGDPITKDSVDIDLYGTGGPGYTIPAEIRPEHTHKKGAVAAARRGDEANPMKESSGSQFYIVVDEKACEHLNGEYTVFGEVIDGMNVVDRINRVETDYLDRPIDDIRINSIKLHNGKVDGRTSGKKHGTDNSKGDFQTNNEFKMGMGGF